MTEGDVYEKDGVSYVVRGGQLTPMQQSNAPLGAVRSGLQGMTFGFADELGAGAGALMSQLPKIGSYLRGEQPSPGFDRSIPDVYREMRGDLNQQQAQFQQENPGLAIGSELTGALLSGGVGGLKAANTLMARTHPLATTMGLGAATGGIYGAGNAPTMQDVPAEAGKGALLGGAAAGVTYPIVNAAVPLLSKTANMMMRPTIGPRTAAASRFEEALARDGISVDDLIENQVKLGPMGRAVDSGGENVLDLADTIATVPGAAKQKAREFLIGRQKQQFDRLMGDVRRTLGADGKYLQTFQEMTRQRASQARPLYEAARADEISEDALGGLLDGLQAKIKEYEGTTIGNALKSIQRKFFRTVEKPDGTFERVLKTNVGRDLHAVKLDIDDTIKRMGARGNAKYEVTQVKNQLLELMDEASPSYGQARSVYSTDSGVLDAMETGKRILRDDVEEMAGYVQGLTGAEKDAFMVGAAKAIRDKLATVGDRQNAGMRIAGNPGLREKLRPAFPSDEAYDDFVNSVVREERFTEVKNKLLANSRTALRQEGVQDLAEMGADFATGDRVGAVVRLLKNTRDLFGRKQQLPEELRTELGKLMFEMGPDEVRRALSRRGISQDQIEFALNKIGTAAAGMSGAAVGAAR